VPPVLQRIGNRLARYLAEPSHRFRPTVVAGREAHWWDYIVPGDVLLVEGNSRISTAIKYLTQSTWSHTAICVGDAAEFPLVEADVVHGVIAVPFSKYAQYNVRICRPVGLTDADRGRLVAFVTKRLGLEYDLKNVFDLARYLFPVAPVPSAWRRQLLRLGSGEPTRAICSTLVAEAYSSIPYPILPNLPKHVDRDAPEVLYEIRHHSTFTPRDFDLSPYFDVVKPTIQRTFDYQQFPWQQVIWLI